MTPDKMAEYTTAGGPLVGWVENPVNKFCTGFGSRF